MRRAARGTRRGTRAGRPRPARLDPVRHADRDPVTGVMGEVPIMPTTGAVTSGDNTKYASTFSHDDEARRLVVVAALAAGAGADLRHPERCARAGNGAREQRSHQG